MTEKLLLEIVIILLGCLLACFGYMFKRHDAQHQVLQADVAAIKGQRLECDSIFATKGAVERAHTRIDEAGMQLNDLSMRVTRLEAGGHGRPHEL